MSKIPILTSIVTATALTFSQGTKADDIKPNCELEKTIKVEFDSFNLRQGCDGKEYVIIARTLPSPNDGVTNVRQQLCNKYEDVLTFKARREGFVGYVVCPTQVYTVSE